MHETTVGQLIHALEAYPEDAPVRIVMQPHYPLQEYVGRDLAFRTSRDGVKAVYVMAVGQPSRAPYAPDGVFDEGGREEECFVCGSTTNLMEGDSLEDIVCTGCAEQKDGQS